MGKQKHMKYHRKRTAVTAGLLAIALSITATFAWYSISQRTLNEGQLPSNAGGRVHDDYHFQNVLNGVSDVANKDIYAENFGETNLLVRMKVSEYLEVDRRVITGGSKEDRSTWVPYVLGNTETARNFVEWQMGGSKVFLPTFNIDQESLQTDAKGDAIDQIAGVATGIGDGSSDYFTPAGTHFEPNGTKVDIATQTSHTSKSTLIQDREVISMETWLTLNKEEQIGNFWVVDADGWAYWANFLEPDQATSLLVSQLTFNRALVEGTLYYVTNAIGEFATAADVDNFYNGKSEHGDASSNAQDLLDAIIGVEYRLEVPEDVTLDKGESRALTGTVIKQTPLGEVREVTDAKIEYTISGISTVTEDGIVTIDPNETQPTVVLEVYAPEYRLTETVTITVPTIPSTPGQIFEDENGIEWRVIVPDDGNGNALIITEHVHGVSSTGVGVTYGPTATDPGSWMLYEESRLKRDFVDPWYRDNVGNDIKANALHYVYTGLNGVERLNPSSPGWDTTANVRSARTVPGQLSTKGDGRPFVFSISEVNHYSANGALNRPARNVNNLNRHNLWYLRSPGSTRDMPSSGVDMTGNITRFRSSTHTGYFGNTGFRAALWVRR